MVGEVISAEAETPHLPYRYWHSGQKATCFPAFPRWCLSLGMVPESRL